MTQPELKACPTCGEDTVKELGLRDYSRWVNPLLPGKLGGSDVDFILDQAGTGRILVMEYKEGQKRLGVGQRLMLTALKHKGIDVWVVWEFTSQGYVLAGELDDTGEVRFTEKLTPHELGLKTKAWWYSGYDNQQGGTR